ncbi:hypothetical protein QUG98_06335 [Curtobacterium sp. RHCJP20]|uniref:Uncharacterized protein n=1 Tax=Curtobacterium subtropicum TaxID=3055138 RepID=A0ABT7TER4_9MICO|nr:hypothetical protein [Curtobacterium subtropicum]MDM7888066.1 hypothetical protein [Curtobacterium subtropicum]
MDARPTDPAPRDTTAGAVEPADLDPEDAFGHSVLPDAARDAVWGDEDDDDIDV